MSIITSESYYRFAKILSILLFPLLVCIFIFVEVEDHIIVDGVVEAKRQITIASPLKQTLVEKVLVEPGEEVSEGQSLILLADLEDWRTSLEAKVKRQTFLDERAAAMERLEKTGSTPGPVAREKRLEAEILRLEIAGLKKRIARLTIAAPFAGKVTSVITREQASVDIGTPLLDLSSLEEKVIHCSISENRFASLKEGQPVAIKSNMFNFIRYDIYKGRIENFATYGAEQEGRLLFDTTISLSESAAKALKIGTTARCEIIVDKRPLYLVFMEKN